MSPNLSAHWILTVYRVCVCVSAYTWPDLPLQTSYLGRCSSLRLLWSCSKPWRRPESSPGLDQSSTHLENWEEGTIREQHIGFEVNSRFLWVEAKSQPIQPLACMSLFPHYQSILCLFRHLALHTKCGTFRVSLQLWQISHSYRQNGTQLVVSIDWGNLTSSKYCKKK